MRTDVLIKQPFIAAIHSLEPFIGHSCWIAIHARMRVCAYACVRVRLLSVQGHYACRRIEDTMRLVS